MVMDICDNNKFMTDFTKIGHWSFIGGLVLAVLAAFVKIPYLALILFVLGLVVGFLNIKEKESAPFLISVIALLVIGVAGLQLGQLTPAVFGISNNFIAFISAAGLVVAVKRVLALGPTG